MEGEFERECEEYGGCGKTVSDQYNHIKVQLLSGVIDKDRAAVGKEFDDLWSELQAEGDIPADDTTGSVTKSLQKAEIKAANDLEDHVKKDKEPKWINRKWKDLKKIKERRRALLHQVALTALAVNSAAGGPLKNRDKGNQALTSPPAPPPTAPLYPPIPREELPPSSPPLSPPPYGKANQMPLFVIQEGVLNAEVVDAGDYEAERARLTKETREALIKVEQMKQDVARVQNLLEVSETIHRESMAMAEGDKSKLLSRSG